jgi:peptide/nickel transport system permease protein
MGRFGFIAKRMALTVPLLLGVVLLVFLVLQITPGDPVRQIVGLRASVAELEKVRAELGLDDPVLIQFVRYVGNVAHGDLGFSYKSQQPVAEMVGERLPVTAWLLIVGSMFAVLISIPLAIRSALHPGGVFDRIVQGLGLLGLTMPSFWVGIVLILAVALPTGLFPVAGFGKTSGEHARSIVLPAVTLAVSIVPLQIRSLRASILSVLESDYVVTARAMGLSRGQVMTRFVLRNAAPPSISVLALNLGYLLFGAVVIETTFALPGIGQGIVLAARSRDLPSIQGYALLFAVLVVAVYLIADILIALVDPRVEITS